MKTLLLSLIIFFANTHLYSQKNHPPIICNYGTSTSIDLNTGLTKSHSTLTSFTYGDTTIMNNWKGRKAIIRIMKQEPEAYKLYRRSDNCSFKAYGCWVGGTGLFLHGLFNLPPSTGPFIVDGKISMYMVKAVWPIVTGLAAVAAGAIFYWHGMNLYWRSFKVFNEGAISEGYGKQKRRPVTLMFGLNCLPGQLGLYPGMSLNF